MKTFLLRGVPNSVQMDGWWLGAGAPPPQSPRPGAGFQDGPFWALRPGALIGLIALADLLLWQVAPGLSLAVFGMAVLVTAWALAGQRGSMGLGLAVLAFLPVVERVQALSVAFWVAGMLLGAAWIAVNRWPGLAAGLRLLVLTPGHVLRDLRGLLATAHNGPAVQSGLKTALLGWAVPLGLGLLFTSLLISANPMLESWANRLVSLRGLSIDRMMFWAGLAVLLWPFLSLPDLVQRLQLDLSSPRPHRVPAMINAASVRRSLILFNAVFAVQTLTDAAYLWGGAALPDGLSYAQYAHRGAYPLLVTALLAGAFTLVARPFTLGNSSLRAVLLAWVAQTLILVISSLTRLDLYVSTYGLTHLRLAALIWMGVVALGLVLVIWQVLRNHSAGWLLLRTAALGVATLYAACFLSFAATVATYNLSRDLRLDWLYLCYLDTAALPAITAYEQATGKLFCTQHRPPQPQISDWREWGFRDWRVQRSLAAITEQARPQWPQF